MSTSGPQAERAAEKYLKQQGLRPKQRNFNSQFGEIDLIMMDGPTCVFVEVRYRNSASFVTPAETVNASKQAKLRRTAEYFLQSQRLLDKVPCRFDVVSITGQLGPKAEIIWIKNAF